MRISDWSSDVCSSDLLRSPACRDAAKTRRSKIRHKNTESVEIRSASRGLVADADRFTHRQLVELVRPHLQELEARSARRRVGKERVCTCSSRWSPYQ